jgi:peptidoglycan LD-endopeptidase CwlK
MTFVLLLRLTAAPPDPHISRLVAAYPDFLAHASHNAVVWKDGDCMIWDDGKEKTFAELEADPDLQDMFAFPYRKDTLIFRENYDPGRIRNEAFFRKMYGNDAAEVERNLVTVEWIDGRKLRVTKINGVDQALRAVISELRTFPALREYLQSPGGTYYWRKIAGTPRLSAHSFGIAVDINTAYSDYWRWSTEFSAGKPLVFRNRIPMEIVRIFEQHGFIWGGRWYHYDTMHFEYRPELL